MENKKQPQARPGQETNVKNDFIRVQAVCAAITEKAICLNADDFSEAWLPFSKISIEPLIPEKGEKVIATIPQWLLERVKLEATANKSVRYTDLLQIKGYCTHITPKAFIVLCDVDNEERAFAKSKIIKLEDGGAVKHPITLIIPAWMVKRANGNLPAWVTEVRA